MQVYNGSIKKRIPSLFWLLPPAEQHQRIRKLAASRLKPEQIASVCGMNVSQVVSIIEAAP